MTEKTLKPYEWIRKIPSSLREMDEVPLLGHPPEFPWEELSQQLSQSLELQDFHIKPSDFRWREADELLSGLGDPVAPLKFSVAPFEGELLWVMSEESVDSLMAFILGEKPAQILESDYRTGFYHFLALEVISAVDALNYNSEIAPQINKNSTLPEKPMLTMDVSLTLKDEKKTGRLFISPELRKSVARHYADKAEEAPFRSPLADKVEVTLHLEAGSLTLTRDEWSKVGPGDFLVLEKCSLQPESPDGKVLLTMAGRPFFRGEIQDGNVKILEHPQYEEVK